jgi:hypothetical protein
MSTSIRAFVFAGAVVSLLPGSSISESLRPLVTWWIRYTGTGSIVTGGFGQCWHTSYWTSQGSIERCDAQTAAATPPPAPVPQAAAPAPAPEPPKAAEQTPPPETQPLQRGRYQRYAVDGAGKSSRRHRIRV